jgi:hypothetical protein
LIFVGELRVFERREAVAPLLVLFQPPLSGRCRPDD